MQLTINIFNLPPCPRNRSHMLTISKGRPMNIKTPLTREFEKDLESRLQVYLPEFEKFRSEFNPKEHYLKALYVIHTPSDLLLTKDGTISSRAGDLDGHKCFQDTIFRVMGLDDKLVREVTYYSPQSIDNNWNYNATFTIKPIEHLRLQSDLL